MEDHEESVRNLVPSSGHLYSLMMPPKPVLVLFALILVGAGLKFFGPAPEENRRRAEVEQGMKLPASARNFQCKGDAHRGFLDRGSLVMFEMSRSELSPFVKTLPIKDRCLPLSNSGDPTKNGYAGSAWGKNTSVVTPGNEQYGGLRKTWSGLATPMEAFGCASPVGDWLCVQLWELENGDLLVKMYTDWN